MTVRIPTLQKFYDEERPWLEAEANDGFLLEASKHPITIATLRAAAIGLGDLREGGKLSTSSEWEDPWQEFLAQKPEFHGYGTMPNKEIAFDLVFKALTYGEQPSVSHFIEIASQVPCPLIKSVAARDRESDIAEATRLVEELLGTDSNGNLREGFSYFRQIDGARIRVTAAELTAVSLDGLRRIAAEVREQRRLEKLSSEEFRAERSALQNEIRSQRITQLINEATGVEFTRKELITLIKTGDKRPLHNLLYFHDGSPRLGAQECIDRILGVRREATREYAENYGRKF